MEKLSQQYSAVSLARILQGLERRIEALQQPKLRRIKSVAAEAAQNLAVNEAGYVLDDTGQSFDLVVRGEDSRLYRISGQASAVAATSSSGGTTDHGSLSGLTDDDHTQYLLRSVLTTKGDLPVRDSSAITRQAVGADNKPLVADSAQTTGVRYGGKILVDEAEIDADLNHDGSNVGFYGVTPAARPSAYTQTYSTATRTHAARTAASLTDNSAGTANTTVEALPDPADTPASADALRDDLVANLLPALRNNFADLAAQINALKADGDNTAQVLNSCIDDRQLDGLAQ